MNDAAAGAATRVTPLPRRSMLADDVYEASKALIMDHAVAPGARVSIDGLARQLGVSPTPVREALARLESAGLWPTSTGSACSSSHGRRGGPQSALARDGSGWRWSWPPATRRIPAPAARTGL